MSGLSEDKIPMLETLSSEPSGTWRSFASLEEAKHLIDIGTLLSWKDQKHLQKILSYEELGELFYYCAARMAERVENRLGDEIVLEWLVV